MNFCIRIAKKSCFKAKDGSVFQAEIIGVSFNGNLKIATNGLIKEFDLKSIELIDEGGSSESSEEDIE